MSLRHGLFGKMTKNIFNFFVMFIQDNALYILVDFENDRRSLRESASFWKMPKMDELALTD